MWLSGPSCPCVSKLDHAHFHMFYLFRNTFNVLKSVCSLNALLYFFTIIVCKFVNSTYKIYLQRDEASYLFKLNESIAEGISSFPVSDDLTTRQNKHRFPINVKQT